MQVNLKNDHVSSSHGLTLGLLRLDTRFPRFSGDGGRADAFACPVLELIVPDADPLRVVTLQEDGLASCFVQAARMLEMAGAHAITTSCGFLLRHQTALANAVSVPVISSALLAVADLQTALALTGQKLGILTISEGALRSNTSLALSGPHAPIIMAPSLNGPFAAPILADEPTRSFADGEADLVATAKRLIQQAPDCGAILLECTNMAPHTGIIASSTGRPVLSLVSLLSTMLRAKSFDMTTAVKMALV